MERKPADKNRRKVQERRITDSGPPCGVEERRTSAERRHPQVAPIDFEDWVTARADYYYAVTARH